MNNQFRPTRVAVVNSHPIQYFGPLYAHLNRSPQLEVTALYLSDFSLRNGVDAGFGRSVTWDIDVLAGYRSVFIAPRHGERTPGGFWSMVAPRIWSEVASGRYDVLWLHGHGYAANWVALAAARFAGMPAFIRGETHLGLARPAWKRRLRKLVMPSFYRQFDACLAIGSANRDYYLAMGVPNSRIHLMPYAVDNRRFAEASRLTPKQRAAVRRRLGVADDRPIVLFASKFTRRKCPDDLLAAFARLKTEMPRLHLVLAGSGEMDAQLRRYVDEQELRECVHFAGFVNQSALPELFGACDAFVLPSDNEPWGLIVNEAMAAGLPVVVASGIGCTADLVKPGTNGATFAAGDIEGLARAIGDVVGEPRRRRAMAEASRRIIAEWGYDQVRDGLLAAIAATRTRRSLGASDRAAMQAAEA